MHDIKKIITCFILILVTGNSFGQQAIPSYIISKDTSKLAQNTTGKVHVKDVTVAGTKKTKVYIVFREIQFKKGDSINLQDLYKELEQTRFQVYNTTLFNEVNVELTAIDADNISVNVQLTERWYLYPVPQFQLIDRNFNDWYKTHNASLNRVNYGIKLVHYNLSGRRDQLRLYLINGYTRNISFSYSNPYSTSSLNEGFTVGAGYSQSREVPYKTDSSNKTLFYKQADFVRNAINVNAGFSIRKGLFRKQVFTLAYTHIKVDDSVLNVKYNPAYFNDPNSSQDVIDIRYVNQYTNVNNVSYPLKGRTSYIVLHKRGLSLSGGINMFSIEAGYNRYFNMSHGWYSSVQLNGKLVLPFKQAFINQRGLGYGENYLRGLEYYVVDGVASGILKSTIKKKLVAFDVPFRFFPKLLTKIPFTVFAKSYADIGYAYNKKNGYTYLNNRFLYTGGFGIDILTLYDINLRFEYSFNQLKENGLFLHNQSGF